MEETETEKERQKLRDSIKYSSLGNDKIFYKGMQTDLKEWTSDDNKIIHFQNLLLCKSRIKSYYHGYSWIKENILKRLLK